MNILLYAGEGMSTWICAGGKLSILTYDAGRECPLPHVPHGLSKFGVEDSGIAENLIKRWLDKCADKHPKCRGIIGDVPTVLPTRVIEIQAPEVFRLRTVSIGDERGQYTCLSHCWSGIVPLRTTSETLPRFDNTGIPWETLPLSFHHAINMTSRLGLKHIWINSLCIIQDDIEDWRMEGVKWHKYIPKHTSPWLP